MRNLAERRAEYLMRIQEFEADIASYSTSSAHFGAPDQDPASGSPSFVARCKHMVDQYRLLIAEIDERIGITDLPSRN